MIQPNELHIGITLNIFKFEKVGFHPVTIDKQRLIALLNGEETTYYPIPLTPDILEKLPFKKWKNSNIFSIDFEDGQSIQVRPERKEVVLFGSDAATDGHGFVIDNIEFLHQLQNIFGTIGKELEIKLQPDALI